MTKLHSHAPLPARQLEKLQKAASAAHTYFVANPSHLEMRNNIEKYRRMEGVTEEAFQDREIENEKHWVRRKGTGQGNGMATAVGNRILFTQVRHFIWVNRTDLSSQHQ